jgi:hypothetical protein
MAQWAELEQRPEFKECQRVGAQIAALEAELSEDEELETEEPAAETGAAEIDTKSSGRPPGTTSVSGCRRVTEFLNQPGNNKEKLAASSGVKPRTIQRLKAGYPMSQEVWTAVARAMGLSFDELIAP